MGANSSKSFQQVGAVAAGLTSWVSRSRKRKASDGAEDYDALDQIESPVKVAKTDGDDSNGLEASATNHDVDEGVGLSDSDEQSSREGSPPLNSDTKKKEDETGQPEERDDENIENEEKPLISSAKRRSSRLRKAHLKRKTASPNASIPEATQVKSPSKRRSLRTSKAEELHEKVETESNEKETPTEEESLMADNDAENVTETKSLATESDRNDTETDIHNGNVLTIDNKPEDIVNEDMLKLNENGMTDKPLTALTIEENATSEQPLTAGNDTKNGDVNEKVSADNSLKVEEETSKTDIININQIEETKTEENSLAADNKQGDFVDEEKPLVGDMVTE